MLGRAAVTMPQLPQRKSLTGTHLLASPIL